MGKDTIILSADTSSPKFSCALLKGDELISSFKAEEFNRHSSDLLPEIDRMIKESPYTIDDIRLYCVGIGPGSFTGLRIGLTTMRGLALALKRPIIGIPSIDAIAYNAIGSDTDISVIIDAKQNKVYARIYKIIQNQVRPKTKILLLDIKELLLKIKSPTLFIGDAISLYKDQISGTLKQDARFAPEAIWHPEAAVIGKLGFEKFLSGKRDNVFTLSPLYIYPKECQIRKL